MTTLFPRGLLNLLKPSSAANKPVPNLGSGKTRIPSDESVTRFIFKDRHLFKKTNLAKPQAFLPEVIEGVWETSLCRKTNVPDERISSLGDSVRHPLKSIAHATLRVGDVEGCSLRVVCASLPDFDEHSVAIDWPDPDDDGKAKQLAIATNIAEYAHTVLVPQ